MKTQINLHDIYPSDSKALREIRNIELTMLQELLPDVKDYLPNNVLRVLLPSFTLYACRMPLAEYTSYVSGILRAAEQILVMILSRYKFVDSDGNILDFQNVGFGELFLYNKDMQYYYISKRNITLLKSPKFGRVLCAYYSTFKNYRNRYFHSRCRNCKAIPRVKSIDQAKKIIVKMSACINDAVSFVKEDS